MSQHENRQSHDYERVGAAIRYIEQKRDRNPSLREIAASVHLSEYHFQRLFKRWVGISPKRFLQYLTVEHVKLLIDESRPLLDTAFEAGLSGPGRLHDLFVSAEAVTPGDYKRRGGGLTIRYGVHDSPFGHCMLAATGNGICWLSFFNADHEDSLDQLRQTYPEAVFVADTPAVEPFIGRIFGTEAGGRLPLYVEGTNFQLQVWKALLTIPPGAAATYRRIAEYIGKPSAARAVGNAVAANPVSYLIPCHRVIRESGIVGRYRWGSERKKAIIAYESAAAGNR